MLFKPFNQDYHVHAYASNSVWQWWNDIIHEGNFYEFMDFETREATGFLRPVSSMIRIHFTHVTTGHEIIQPPLFIPMHKFELKSVKELCDYSHSLELDHVPAFSMGKQIL